MQLVINLDPHSSNSLQNQLFESIRQLILSGQLKVGSAVPATRVLREQLHVSRNTVLLAYERLIAEGYLETRPTVGTFVSTSLPEGSLFLTGNGVYTRKLERQAPRQPVLFSGRCQSVVNPNRSKLAIDFWVGRPDPHSFPTKSWRRRLLHNLTTAGSSLTEYCEPTGIEELRCAIADHLGPTRGMKVNPEQVVIVNGSQQGLNLIARLMVEKGSAVVTECPCYQGAAFVFESYGAVLKPVPVDENGLDPSKLPQGPVSIAYVTPSHQYPMGVTLNLNRRIRLLEWARETGAYIIEDDYDSDFRYTGSPLTSLAGLDKHGSVFYMGTFSKSIGAGIRLGYLVVPQDLVSTVRTAKALMDNGHAWLDQATLADFISSGSFMRHLRRIRHKYQLRRDCLVEQLQRHFGDVRLTGLQGGMHLIWHLPPHFPTADEVQRIAEQVGVGVYSLEAGAAFNYDCNICGCSEQALMFGYSPLSEPMIQEGIERLAKALAEADSRYAAVRSGKFKPTSHQGGCGLDLLSP